MQKKLLGAISMIFFFIYKGNNLGKCENRQMFPNATTTGVKAKVGPLFSLLIGKAEDA